MSKIKHAYNWGDYREVRKEMGEDRDCTVVSLAQVLEIPYREAHSIMRLHAGRVNGRGSHMGPVSDAYPAALKRVSGLPMRSITLAEFCRVHNTGRYWVEVTGHALAVVNGKILDHSRKVRRLVVRAWRVDKSAYHGRPTLLIGSPGK